MQIRDRIKSLRRVAAKNLKPNPKNWRTHPDHQRDALKGVLSEIGIADACIARELEDGSLELIDGHLRTETMPDQKIPVLILDVTREEAEKILVTLDPLAGLAGADAGKLESLLSEIDMENDSLQAMLADIMVEAEVQPESGEIVPLEMKPPPKMTWVLVGIPTVRFGEVADLVEAIAEVDDVIVETTSNDG